MLQNDPKINQRLQRNKIQQVCEHIQRLRLCTCTEIDITAKNKDNRGEQIKVKNR